MNNLPTKTTDELGLEVTQLQNKMEEISSRLAQPGLSDETVRALLKTKNELYADIQAYEVELDKRNKPFARSLNESFEL